MPEPAADAGGGEPSRRSIGPVVLSLHPVMDHVLHGSTDTLARLKELIKSAPPNSYLTTWHEALSLKYPSYITNNSMFQLHARMNTLAQGSNVTYGVAGGIHRGGTRPSR